MNLLDGTVIKAVFQGGEILVFSHVTSIQWADESFREASI